MEELGRRNLEPAQVERQARGLEEKDPFRSPRASVERQARGLEDNANNKR
ncbi:hypothetical protein RZS08_06760 [Arthrospira platensis SPKY1]|nr:hypothetical protein [Arthrospira platensis SPKY1]